MATKNRRGLRVVAVLLAGAMLLATFSARPSSASVSFGFAATIILAVLAAVALIVVGILVGQRILDRSDSDTEKSRPLGESGYRPSK